MAAKKHSKRTTADKTTTARPTADATNQTVAGCNTDAGPHSARCQPRKPSTSPMLRRRRSTRRCLPQGNRRESDSPSTNPATPSKKLSALGRRRPGAGRNGSGDELSGDDRGDGSQGLLAKSHGTHACRDSLFRRCFAKSKPKATRHVSVKTGRGRFALRENVT